MTVIGSNDCPTPFKYQGQMTHTGW